MNAAGRLQDTRSRGETQLFRGVWVGLASKAGWGLLLWLLLWPLTVAAAPARQASPPAGGILLPVLVPAAPASVTLHTHQATVTVVGQDDTLLQLAATYTVHNETAQALRFQVRLVNAGASMAVAQAGVPLVLEPTAEGLLASVDLPADGAAVLSLDATFSLAEATLLRVEYPTALLRQWPGQRSTRVEVVPGTSVDSWLRVEPASWRYTPLSEDLRMEWLFEGELPARLLFLGVAPSAQSALDSLHASAFEGTAEVPASLAARYRRLAAAAAALDVPEVQDRFMAQAAAVYGEGIRQAQERGRPVNEYAILHVGLAALYREGAAQNNDPNDARMMVAEIERALQGIGAEDPRRAELQQWQAEGMRLLLTGLRRAGDLSGALALLDQLEGAETGESQLFAQERQALLQQLAVQLVEAGDRAAALALAGERMVDPALQPPAEYRNLFARWTISATLSANGVEVLADVALQAEQAAAAQAALEAVMASWETLAQNDRSSRLRAALAGEGRLSLFIPAGQSGSALANRLPAGADWALLRQLLGQLGPQIRTRVEGFRQQIEVAQPLDLRAAGEQWERIAAELDRQADELVQAATQTTATLQEAQEWRLRAANQRATAQAWRSLAQNSQVVVSLAVPDAPSARNWLVTLSSPPQLLRRQAEAVSQTRLLLGIVVLLGSLFVGSTLLWRLI